MSDIDDLLASLDAPVQRKPQSVLPVFGSEPGKSLARSSASQPFESYTFRQSVTGFKEIPSEFGSTFRLWDQDKPWQGAAHASRAVQVDNLSSNDEPIAVLRSDVRSPLCACVIIHCV